MTVTRILFASCHGYLDPSSGAARSTQELLELLAARGIDCRALSTGVLDYRQETPLETVLAPLQVPIRCAAASLSQGGAVEVLDLALGGVRITLLPTHSSRYGHSPDRVESAVFLDLAEQVFERFRPQALLTFGGHPANIELMARARRRGVAVVFHLRNFSYTKRQTFAHAQVVVPSDYSRRFYAERLGLSCTVIPNPISLGQVVARDPRPRFLTFVNPVADKGVTVVARIALELGRRRPDIPLLIVEGRGTAEELARAGPDLSGLTNLYRMASTPDPRVFYRVSRAILMPSLWRESFGRAAAEALANGLPVLASDRGALPETLGDAGLLLPLPERCTPESGAVPTAEEVTPWLAAIERLWDDPAWEAEQRAKARAAARRWDTGRIIDQYETFLRDLVSRVGSPEASASPEPGRDWLTWSDEPVELDLAAAGDGCAAQGDSEPTSPASGPARPGGVLPFRAPPPGPTPAAVCTALTSSDSDPTSVPNGLAAVLPQTDHLHLAVADTVFARLGEVAGCLGPSEDRPDAAGEKKQ